MKDDGRKSRILGPGLRGTERKSELTLTYFERIELVRPSRRPIYQLVDHVEDDESQRKSNEGESGANRKGRELISRDEERKVCKDGLGHDC